MEQLDELLFKMRVELLLWLPWAAVSLLLMAWFAFGRRLSWDGAPSRVSAINLAGPMAGLMLMIVGGALAHQIVALMPSPAEVSRITMVGLAALLLQVGSLGSASAVFIIWAMAGPPPSTPTTNGLVPRRPGHELLVGFVAFLLVTPAVMGCNTVMVFIGELLGHGRPLVGHEMLQLMRDAQTWTELSPLLISAILLAPLFEELIFRGLVQTPLVQFDALRRRRWIVILISAALFTAVHSAIIWQVVAGLFLLGVTLAWLYERTGSLLPSFVVHVLFNATNVVLALTLAEPTQV